MVAAGTPEAPSVGPSARRAEWLVLVRGCTLVSVVSYAVTPMDGVGVSIDPAARAADLGVTMLTEKEAYADMSKRLLQGWTMLEEVALKHSLR